MDGFNFADVGKAMIGLGPGGVVAGLMYYLYRDEKADRKEAQAQNVKLLEGTIVSRHELASVLEKIAAKVGA